jgi:hypothetical protein
MTFASNCLLFAKSAQKLNLSKSLTKCIQAYLPEPGQTISLQQRNTIKIEAFVCRLVGVVELLSCARGGYFKVWSITGCLRIVALFPGIGKPMTSKHSRCFEWPIFVATK